jgi:osmotically-inducible protein OsmY
MKVKWIAVASVLSLLPALSATQACLVPDAAALQKDVAKYKSVTVTVDDCIVHLNGQVNRLSDSWDVERKFRTLSWVSGVRNELAVTAPSVEDGKLQKNVVSLISEEGYSDLRAPLSVGVQQGVVTLNGIEPNPMLLDSMLYAVASVKGVRGILSTVRVDPMLNIDEIVEWTPRTTILWNQYVGPMYPKQ